MKSQLTTMDASAAPAALTAADVLAGLKRGMAEIEAIMRPAEQALEQLFTAHGFNVRAGDIMLVPRGTDIAGVPPRYRPQVKVSPLVRGVTFMKSPGGLIGF